MMSSELETETSDGNDVFESSEVFENSSDSMFAPVEANQNQESVKGGSEESPRPGTSASLNHEDKEKRKSFVPFTKEQEDMLLAKLPKSTKSILDKATGILYMDRYETFVLNNWPYDVKKGNLCHPRALALAGLSFYSLDPSPSAQCQVCLYIFKDLQPNSNPWIMHTEACPDCFLVTLGQRDEADDYTMDQAMEMALRRVVRDAEVTLMEKENRLKKQLCKLMKVEKRRGKQKPKKAKGTNAVADEQ